MTWGESRKLELGLELELRGGGGHCLNSVDMLMNC
jgi:hypothetical protein